MTYLVPDQYCAYKTFMMSLQPHLSITTSSPAHRSVHCSVHPSVAASTPAGTHPPTTASTSAYHSAPLHLPLQACLPHATYARPPAAPPMHIPQPHDARSPPISAPQAIPFSLVGRMPYTCRSLPLGSTTTSGHSVIDPTHIRSMSFSSVVDLYPTDCYVQVLSPLHALPVSHHI